MQTLHVFELIRGEISVQASACEIDSATQRGLLSVENSALETIIRHETEVLVRYMFFRLSLREQQVIFGYLTDKTPEEIAKEIEVSPERVKIIYKHAKEKLRKELSSYI